jgi:NADH-quinone oxidoreductase subunit F
MHLKRFITDHARRPDVAPVPVDRKQRIAVVGAGPSGLTAALELRRRGYAVTVYEELGEPGGMLRWGIPAYRLPRDVLDREIDRILHQGVELRTFTRVGREVTMEELLDQYAHVYVAVGAHRSQRLRVPGDDAPGVLGAVELLRAFNLGEKPAVGERVAVVGGGNSAVDAARVALRIGAREVTIVYRRERKDMPAQEQEIDAALAEGVRLVELTAPAGVRAEGGRVTGLEVDRMQLADFDASGRRRPVTVAGSRHVLAADTILAAVSQVPDLDFLSDGAGVERAYGLLWVDRRLRSSHPRIWAGGDAVTRPAMVVDAIRDGQRAAQSIDEAVRREAGEGPWVPPPEEKIDVPLDLDEDPRPAAQVPMPEAPPQDRRRDFREVELGYTAELARAEASRCLRCGGGRRE